MSLLSKIRELVDARAASDPEVSAAVAAKRGKLRESVSKITGLLGELSGQVIQLPDGRRGTLQVYQTAECACVGIQEQEWEAKEGHPRGGWWKSSGKDIGGWEVWPRGESYSVQFDAGGVTSGAKTMAQPEQVADYMAEQVAKVILIEQRDGAVLVGGE